MADAYVGLDIGTNKTRAVIGFMNENGVLEIAGVGNVPSVGSKNGVIINIDNTVKAIEKSVDDAIIMAGCEAANILVGVTGTHLKGENSNGIVAVSHRNRVISRDEINRVVGVAKNKKFPADRQILHVLSREFTVDDQIGIKDPLGMSGVRLEAEVHIVTGAITSIQNLKKSVSRAGFLPKEVIFSPLAAAEAVLSAAEMELGVALVDIGGGTIDIVIFLEGGIYFSSVLPVGGMHVTRDISIGLNTPIDSAEVIKQKYGCALVDLVDPSETIEVPSVGDRAPRRLLRQELAQFIEPRIVEMMQMIDYELDKSGKKDLLAAGVVLTGGGSMLEGTLDAAEQVLGMPVRIGTPKDIAGLRDVVSTPQYSVAVGLLKYGIQHDMFRNKFSDGKESSKGHFGKRFKKMLEEYL